MAGNVKVGNEEAQVSCSFFPEILEGSLERVIQPFERFEEYESSEMISKGDISKVEKGKYYF